MTHELPRLAENRPRCSRVVIAGPIDTAEIANSDLGRRFGVKSNLSRPSAANSA